MLWYLKQLLPLKYNTVYGEGGKWISATWRMWLGRCYQVNKVVIGTM